MTSNTDQSYLDANGLFTPPQGTIFCYAQMFDLIVVKVEGDKLICRGVDEMAGQTFGLSEEDRRTMSAIGEIRLPA